MECENIFYDPIDGNEGPTFTEKKSFNETNWSEVKKFGEVISKM